MNFIKYILVVVVMGTIAGCNSYSYSNVKSADTNQKVRLVTITDSDGKLVGERHEIYDTRTMGWYDAEVSASGSFILTPAGEAAQTQAQQGGGDSGGGGC